MNPAQNWPLGAFIPTRPQTEIHNNAFVWAAYSAAEATLFQISEDNRIEATECATIMLEFMHQANMALPCDYFLLEIARHYAYYAEFLPVALEIVENLTFGGPQ